MPCVTDPQRHSGRRLLNMLDPAIKIFHAFEKRNGIDSPRDGGPGVVLTYDWKGMINRPVRANTRSWPASSQTEIGRLEMQEWFADHSGGSKKMPDRSQLRRMGYTVCWGHELEDGMMIATRRAQPFARSGPTLRSFGAPVVRE